MQHDCVVLMQIKMELKLCDFCIARLISETSENEENLTTMWYRAPESLLSLNYVKESDYWAIGCIMGELVDGNPIFT